MKKEELFDKLRGGVTQQFDMPAEPVKGIVYEDIIKQFIEISKIVGGKVIEAKASDDLNAVIRKAYPDAKVFVSMIMLVYC